MEEQNTPIPTNAANAQGGTDGAKQNAESAVDKVYDITPDFNIMPVSDAEPSPKESGEPASVSTEPKIKSVPEPLDTKPRESVIPKTIPEMVIPTGPRGQSVPQPLSAAGTTIPTGIPVGQSGVIPETKPAAIPTPNLGTITDTITPPNQDQPVVKTNPNFAQKPLRTYESDVAEFLSQRKTSAASIAMAENARETGNATLGSAPTPDRHTATKLFLVFLSLIIVASGLIGAYYLYLRSPLAPGPSAINAPATAQASTLIPVDSETISGIDALSQNQILQSIRNELAVAQRPGTIKALIFTENGQNVSVADMLARMGITPPDILVRTLENNWTLGIYTDQSGNSDIFVALKTDYFQNAFSGMLRWESVMPDDLKRYLPTSQYAGIANVDVTAPNNNEGTKNTIIPSGAALSLATSSDSSAGTASSTMAGNTASASSTTNSGIAKTAGNTATSTMTATSTQVSTATSTDELPPGFTQYQVLEGRFVDKIISNKDVREFITDDGTPIFLYSFVDNQTLVFAGKESTLSEVIDRLERQSFIR